MSQAWREADRSAQALVIGVLRDTRQQCLGAAMLIAEEAKKKIAECKCGRTHEDHVNQITDACLKTSKDREDALDAAIEILERLRTRR